MTNMLPGLDSPRPSASRRPTRALPATAGALLIATLAACSAAATPSATPGATSGPTTGPSPSPTARTGLEHPTGAQDVVLRFEESGGFVPIEYNATYAPSFTLYGDGTLVFKDPYAPAPETNDNVVHAVPFMVAKLDEASIQALLEEALGAGGLAIAQGPYTCNCADIPTSTFSIAIGGKTKQVSVMGMSPDVHDQDKQIVAALAAFAEKLRTFADVLGNEQPYLPAGYRGILIEVEQPAGPVVAWPWPDLTPADFTSGENEFFKTRDMTPAEVESLGIKDVTGGVIGVSVGAEGKVYTFSLRPLLPDEIK
ncbi:MAG TPA: hypothetical protein VFP56_01360 [Candidatus Limnocylindrales bacterium]|nr:hypothetical protein [Candidatus Limnocylindrales bacterium]